MTTLETAIDTGKSLTLTDIKSDLLTYNYLISLSKECIDTSIYNTIEYKTGAISGVATSCNYLILSTNKNANFNGTKPNKGETRIVIFEDNIIDIKIKSKRNFLENQ